MELVAEELALVQIFRENAVERRREMRLREDDQRLRDEKKVRLERKEKDERDEKQLEEMVLASAEQIAAFNATLDDYDTATVKALMENQHALDDVNHRLEQTEASAYRLPDGRMAFKSEDGQQVYDRQGAQLSRDIIHPEAIPNALPRWEVVKRDEDTRTTLVRERGEQHAFLEKLDQQRDAASRGDATAGALARAKADLERAMPNSVKAQLHGTDTASAEVEAQTTISPMCVAGRRPDFPPASAAP